LQKIFANTQNSALFQGSLSIAAMLKTERQAYILRQIHLHNRILSSDLSVEMNVSEDTIRRDLNELADLDKIIKVHGGALSKSFHSSFLKSDVYRADHKRTIAQKALSLIREDMFILTTGGTTVIELARILPPELRATFFTGSIPAAYEYAKHPNIEVIFLGDKISKNSQIAVGGEAISRIAGIKADLCLMGINAMDTTGVTDNDWEVIEVKKAMIDAAAQTVVLSISEKINTRQRLTICELSDVDTLITELSPSDPLFDVYKQQGLRVL
jgi:DeoR/GlpR family transcriptional regulator of sugar metabolism